MALEIKAESGHPVASLPTISPGLVESSTGLVGYYSREDSEACKANGGKPELCMGHPIDVRELLASGFAVLPGTEQASAAPVAVPEPAPLPKASPDAIDGLAEMGRGELLGTARDLGIEGLSKKTKAEIVEAIRAHE